MSVTPKVFVVDDDEAVRSSLRVLLETDGHDVHDFNTADEFLSGCTPECYGCLITDIQMPGLSGLELQATLEERGIRLPVIILTGHADVPAAVQSLKAGALDFLEKPFDPDSLLELVGRALALDRERFEAEHRNADLQARLARLTPREREVMDHIVDGQSNKVVGIELGISERTVELHRARVMRKLEVRTVAELVRLVSEPRNSASDPGPSRG